MIKQLAWVEMQTKSSKDLLLYNSLSQIRSDDWLVVQFSLLISAVFEFPECFCLDDI